MAQKIIGREKEKKELKNLYESKRPQFLVVYGRRRIGKTFLVREFFNNDFCFSHTGLSPIELGKKNIAEQQLTSFTSSLVRHGIQMQEKPSNWFEAFDILINHLEEKCKKGRQVVFIDELPWLDTPRSGFITAFEHFWNGWGAAQQNLMLIVSGSATSWISDNLINNHGGLYNRLTAQIYLEPFTLHECEEFYAENNIIFDRYDQLQIYMIFGGIPYYLSMLEKGTSLAKNIDNICFGRKAKLANEFQRLYSSLFTNYEECIKIIELLSTHRNGFSRKEIAEKTSISYGGGLTKTLRALEASEFIIQCVNFGKSGHYTTYKLIDFFSLFYLKFMKNKKTDNTFWQDCQFLPETNVWRGLTFETVCFSHIPQIKSALGISGVKADISSWTSSDKKNGAQIDMIINRNDRIINLCEIKFSNGDFKINSNIDRNLRNKLQCFIDETKTKCSLHLTLITTLGLIENEYSGHIQNVITADDLFKF